MVKLYTSWTGGSGTSNHFWDLGTLTGDSQEAEHGIKGDPKRSTEAKSEMKAKQRRHMKYQYEEAGKSAPKLGMRQQNRGWRHRTEQRPSG